MNITEVLAQSLLLPVIEKIKRTKVNARFIFNIWTADLAEMGSLSYFNHGVEYLLCVIHVFTKYAWVKSLTNKKAKTILDGFNEIVNKSKRKSSKLWIDQGREFYNQLMLKWLDDYDSLIY